MFGDLVEAVEYAAALDEAKPTDPIWQRPAPDFAPGTSAQRRTQHHGHHGRLEKKTFARTLSRRVTPPRSPRPARFSRALSMDSGLRGKSLLRVAAEAKTPDSSPPRISWAKEEVRVYRFDDM